MDFISSFLIVTKYKSTRHVGALLSNIYFVIIGHCSIDDKQKSIKKKKF